MLSYTFRIFSSTSAYVFAIFFTSLYFVAQVDVFDAIIIFFY